MKKRKQWFKDLMLDIVPTPRKCGLEIDFYNQLDSGFCKRPKATYDLWSYTFSASSKYGTFLPEYLDECVEMEVKNEKR